MSEVTHWKYHSIKDPIGVGFLGMAICTNKAGQDTILHTVDESGNMETFMYPGEAEIAIKTVITVMQNFKIRQEKSPISKRECGKRLEAFREEHERFRSEFLEEADDDDVI